MTRDGTGRPDPRGAQDSVIAEGQGLIFRVRCHPQYLVQAARASDLNPNAVVIEDADMITSNLGAASAIVDFPSYFCTQRHFVLVLAFLARRGQPFEIILLYSSKPDDEINSYALIFPSLDDHTLAILRSIDPVAADDLSDLNRRIETVITRLRELRFSPDFDAAYEMVDDDPEHFSVLWGGAARPEE
ncbi:MAG: hypothetical protein NXI16_03010 [Alphaproteobacteria bacterium]|nr:hypothetical protein [Alphaproteobacteria bacterium]